MNSIAMGVRYDGESTYVLIDADGNQLTTKPYTWIYAMSSSSFFKVEVRSADGVHDEGIIDSTGAVIVPAVYADVEVISDRWTSSVNDGAADLIVTNTQNETGLINLNGEMVIPFSEDIRSISASIDGTTVLVYTGNHEYIVYRFEPPFAPTFDNSDEKETVTPALADDTWTCPNGHSGQAGKFCSECSELRS